MVGENFPLMTADNKIAKFMIENADATYFKNNMILEGRINSY